MLLWWFGSVCFALLDYLVGLVWLVGRLMFGQFDLVGWLVDWFRWLVGLDGWLVGLDGWLV